MRQNLHLLKKPSSSTGPTRISPRRRPSGPWRRLRPKGLQETRREPYPSWKKSGSNTCVLAKPCGYWMWRNNQSNFSCPACFWWISTAKNVSKTKKLKSVPGIDNIRLYSWPAPLLQGKYYSSAQWWSKVLPYICRVVQQVHLRAYHSVQRERPLRLYWASSSS